MNVLALAIGILLHGGRGPQGGEVTRLSNNLSHGQPTYQINMIKLK